MRKPLLVVCGATAAVLLAGGVAATTAGADETPGQPGVSGLQFPGLPNFPQFPWADGTGDPDSGDAGPAGAGPAGAIGSDDQDATDGDATDGDATDRDATDGDRDATAGDQGDTNRTAGDGRFPDRPGGSGKSTGRDAGQTATGADAGRTASGDRVPQRAGGARAAAAPAAPAQASLTAAAQRELSPAQVSTSTTAPFQQQVLALINQNRRRGGCGNLTLDRRLIEAAFGHATDMARRDYFAHESPNGDSPGDRVTDAGFQWSRYGENIARGPASAYEVVNGWMHSPEHRENIMDCRFQEMGVGVAFDGDKESYWVQDFGTPSR
jgi:uncharacterized protein YkwD